MFSKLVKQGNLPKNVITLFLFTYLSSMRPVMVFVVFFVPNYLIATREMTFEVAGWMRFNKIAIINFLFAIFSFI